jgi:RND family efflux transporter MFP subunit
MVQRVCRGVLVDPHDSQDAFQATFLVLVKRARTLWVRDSLGPWLHQVAYRTASCARVAAARRRRHERCAAEAAKDIRSEVGDELGQVLHEEIERLPERFRAPLVLCDLEGRTHEQAARHLGWPIGTVKSRQSRGRERLRQRLIRRGLGSDLGLVGVGLSPNGLTALIPPALVDSTTSAVVQFVTAQTIVRGSTASLAREVLRSMSITHWLKVASVLFVLGASASSVGLLVQNAASSTQPPPEGNLKAARTDNLPVLEVKPSKFSVTVVERGSLESSDNKDAYCLVEGSSTIISILPEGTRVKKGQIVCELDSAALKDQLVNQTITTESAKANLDNAKLTREVAEIAVKEYVEGIYQQEHEILTGEIHTASSSIQRADARSVRTRAAQKQLNDALASRPTRTSADVVAKLDIEDRIAAAEQALEKAKIAFDLAKTKRKVLEDYTRGKTTKALESAVERKRSDELAKKATWELELSKEKKLRRQIAACEIKAPSDGLVVYANDPPRNFGNRQRQIEEGATVRERQKIFSLPDITKMQVNAKVREAHVDKLAPRMKARVRVDAFADQVLTATVRDIAPLPDPGSFVPRDIKVYTTHVTIDQPLPGLRPGMTAQVEILVYQAENVLSVPLQAVLTFDGKYHVAVKKAAGGFDWREVTPGEVTLGQENDKLVEVKQGLQSGDVVMLEPLSLMSEAEKREKLGKPTKPASPEPANKSISP